MTCSNPSKDAVPARMEAASLHSRAKAAANLAVKYAWNIHKSDGHWHGELRANATITAEQVFFYQSLGVPIPDADAYRRYLLSQQQSDGSWSIAPDHPGDVSTSAEAYLALKILGVPADDPNMLRGRDFIRSCGGIATVRIFTRIFFAQFGLFPWKAVPQLPAEFILFKSWLPINIYRLASWARSTVIPLLIIRHHKKIYALPNGTSKHNTYLDELWLDPSHKNVPYKPSLRKPRGSDPWSLFFSAIDTWLCALGGLRPLWPLRAYARKKCVRWILEHQETQGDWAGIIPPMHAGVQALLLEGYKLDDDCIRKGIEAIERFTWEDSQGKRLQSCVSPVWDTVLMTRGLCDGGNDPNDERMRKTIRWIKSRQLLGPEGDWRVYKGSVQPGGFSFEYYNAWYPDVDDTAAAILALISQNSVAADSLTVGNAILWICGMQNKDGGWAAFDYGNDRLWLNKIPFSDMDSLADPSSADVTGRVIEAFGKMLQIAKEEHVGKKILDQMNRACSRSIDYLRREQTASGSWYGRWGSNYIYGTSNVLCGLEYFVEGNENVRDMMDAGARWLKQMQNTDGGWGEELQSYRDVSRAGVGPSTPSQTAWALMGLLGARCDPRDQAIARGISHLVETQTDVLGEGASWPESRYTGTGFPNFFYIGYTLYRHYFPMMALGRYCQATRGQTPAVLDIREQSCPPRDSGYSEPSVDDRETVPDLEK